MQINFLMPIFWVEQLTNSFDTVLSF